MTKKRIRFKGGMGHELGALIDFPEDTPKSYALFAHCFTCTKNLKAVNNITAALAGHGIATLRFDFTGLGESEGDFAETSFSSNVGDLVAAANFLKDNYEAPRIMIGHSLGGTASIQAAGKLDFVRAVATIGSSSELTHLSKILKSRQEEIDRDGTAMINIGGQSFKLMDQFFEDLEKSNVAKSIRELNRPLLIFHSPLDRTVGIDHAAQIFMTAKHPKSFVSLDKADHLLTDERDSRYVGSVTAIWAERYI